MTENYATEHKRVRGGRLAYSDTFPQDKIRNWIRKEKKKRKG